MVIYARDLYFPPPRRSPASPRSKPPPCLALRGPGDGGGEKGWWYGARKKAVPDPGRWGHCAPRWLLRPWQKDNSATPPAEAKQVLQTERALMQRPPASSTFVHR